jgi:hypothetical protein
MAITNPVVNKIFNDLDNYRDFCRFYGSGRVFNEKALYNNRDRNWRDYQEYLSGGFRKKTHSPKNDNRTRRPNRAQ